MRQELFSTNYVGKPKFLAELTAPFHFTFNHDKPEPAKGIVVLGQPELGPDGQPDPLKPVRKVRVGFQNRYTLVEDDTFLTPVLGDQVGNCFRQKFELKIDGDKLPADRAEELLEKLQGLFAEYNSVDALTVKAGFAPNEDFHVRRHTILSPEQNLELQKVCPIVVSVATKNVK